MTADIIRGVLPVAPTVFRDDEELDLEGQSRVVDYLVDAGADGICILANYSEQFSLTDSERDQIVDATFARANSRIPVVVAASHFSAKVAHDRSRSAAERGAVMVMLMPPFYGSSMKSDDAAIFEFFKRVADGLEIDIMIQDSPLSPTVLSVELLARLAAEIPQIRYVKIEVPRTSQKIRMLSAAAGAGLPGIYDGEESITLIPDLAAGAQGTMCSSSVVEPLGYIVRQYLAGELEEATREWEKLLPLIHFENRQCGLNAAKVLLKEGGVISSDRTRGPISDLPPDTRRELLELARRHDPLILRWSSKL
jgi:2-keto-3-deoxy-L-arabinonate dehydratase